MKIGICFKIQIETILNSVTPNTKVDITTCLHYKYSVVNAKTLSLMRCQDDINTSVVQVTGYFWSTFFSYFF